MMLKRVGVLQEYLCLWGATKLYTFFRDILEHKHHNSQNKTPFMSLK